MHHKRDVFLQIQKAEMTSEPCIFLPLQLTGEQWRLFEDPVVRLAAPQTLEGYPRVVASILDVDPLKVRLVQRRGGAGAPRRITKVVAGGTAGGADGGEAPEEPGEDGSEQTTRSTAKTQAQIERLLRDARAVAGKLLAVSTAEPNDAANTTTTPSAPNQSETSGPLDSAAGRTDPGGDTRGPAFVTYQDTSGGSYYTYPELKHCSLFSGPYTDYLFT